jgi:Ca2+-binding EF-hand superfamily protein
MGYENDAEDWESELRAQKTNIRQHMRLSSIDQRRMLILRLFEIVDDNETLSLSFNELSEVMGNADVFMKAVKPVKEDEIEMGEFANWVMANVVERLPDDNVVTLNKMMCLALIARKPVADHVFDRTDEATRLRVEAIFEAFDLNEDGELSIGEISAVLGGTIAKDFLASLSMIEKVNCHSLITRYLRSIAQ